MRVSTFASAHSLRALNSQPRSPPFSFHVSRRAWPARTPFASQRSGRAARTAHVPNTHPAGMRSGGDPGHHRPMSATHDFVFKRREPTSRFTPLRASLRVAVAHGSRRIEPASVNMPACRERCLLAPHRHVSRACFVTERVSGRTLTLDDRSPPRYCVHRRSPLTVRRSARVLGVPPDGLDRIRRAA
jgi:hypothetical protein